MPELAAPAPGWMPEDFVRPLRVELSTGHHLRPVGPDDADLDILAVMGSQPRLWAIYGDEWGWPAATLTWEQNHQELVRHAAEAVALEAFSYALFDAAESQILGCVYIDPPQYANTDAEVSWWVVTDLVGSLVEAALDELVPRWLAGRWPFRSPNFPHNPQRRGMARAWTPDR